MEQTMQAVTKVVRAALIFLGMFGIAVWGADWYIAELPPTQRSAGWMWFAAGWATAAIAVALLILPWWMKGRMLPNHLPTQEEIQAKGRVYALTGGVLCLFSGSLGVIGPSLGVGLLAFACGSITAGLGFAIALHTTAKGRAMLDEAKRSNHAA